MRNRLISKCAACAIAILISILTATSAAADQPRDETAEGARAAFTEGTALVHKAQWAEALAAFERAARLRAHPITTYNIGFVERALGRYTRARATLRRALQENTAAGGAELPSSVMQDIAAYLDQIDRLLAVVIVSIEPASAGISVDGRPLEEVVVGEERTYVAGIRDPGPGVSLRDAKFKMVVDPGPRVLTLSRKGYVDAVVNRTLSPGTSTELTLKLDRLPASLHIASNQERAVVMVEGLDVGVAPVDLLRPPGTYAVAVRKPGFLTYESHLVARPGEEVSMRATLLQEKRSITTRWWFWTGVGVFVAGAVLATVFIVQSQQPAPPRPPLDCGGVAWCAPAQ